LAKNSLLLISVLALLIVIAASQPVNKTVNAVAVIRAKPGTKPSVQFMNFTQTQSTQA